MRKYLLLAALCCSVPLFAQTTTYSGTLRDLTGAVVTSGRLTFQLNAPNGGVIPGTGSFVGGTVSCLINASGAPVSSKDGTSPCVVTSNSALTPTGTSYTLCKQPFFVTPGSCFVTYANGGTVDISTIIPTPATQPSYGVASTAASNTWSAPQTFTLINSGAIHPATVPVYDVMSPVYAGGAKCDGVTDDTAALQAAMNAAAGVTNVQPGIFFVPNTGKACLVSSPVVFSSINFHALLHIEGTIRMTAVTTGAPIEIFGYHPGGEALYGWVWGTGIIDANGLAKSALWLHSCTKMYVNNVTVNWGTSYGIRIGDSVANTVCIADVRDANALYEDLKQTPPGKSPSVIGATAIYPDKASDLHVDNLECVGWDICVNSPGSSSKIMNSHCWGNSTQVPTTCFYGSGGGTYWLDDYADGPTQYGFHLTGFNDIIDGGMVYCNSLFCANNTVIGMQFDNANPFATVTNSLFFGGTNNLLEDVDVAGGNYTSMMFSGNTANNTTTSNSTAFRSPHDINTKNNVNTGNSINAGTVVTAVQSMTAPVFNGALSGHMLTFNNSSGAPFNSCAAFSEEGTPTYAAGVVTFPGDGTHNGGGLVCWDYSGTYTAQSVPTTGTTAQTFTMTNLGTGNFFSLTNAGLMSLPTNTQINSKAVCLADGTNCPTTVAHTYFLTIANSGAVAATGTSQTGPALTQAITVDSVSLWANTAPLTCATYPVVNVWDVTAGSSIASVTMASATNGYTMTVTSAAVPSTHQIGMRVSTAPVTCGTNASAISMYVQYH